MGYTEEENPHQKALDEQLFDAVGNKDAKAITSLIAQGADVNAKTYGDGTLLHHAVFGDRNIIELLIEKGANVNANDYRGWGWTPLHLLITGGLENIETAELLIKKGAAVNVKDHYGFTPLHLAVLNGHAEMVKLLLKNNADIYATNNHNETPLDLAKDYRNASRKSWLEVSNLLEEAKKNKTANVEPQPHPQQPPPETSNAINWLAPVATLLGVLGINIVSGNGIGIGGIVTALLAAGAVALGTQAYNKTGLFAPSPTPAAPSKDDAPKAEAGNEQSQGHVPTQEEKQAFLNNSLGIRGAIPDAAIKMMDANPGLAKDEALMTTVLQDAFHHRNNELIKDILYANPGMATKQLHLDTCDGPAFAVAVRRRNSEVMKYIAENLPKAIEARGPGNETAFHAAAEVGDLYAIKLAYKLAPDLIKVKDDKGRTCLDAAIDSPDLWNDHTVVQPVDRLLKLDSTLASEKGKDDLTPAQRLRSTSGSHTSTKDMDKVLKLLDAAAATDKAGKPKDKENVTPTPAAQTSIDHPAMHTAIEQHRSGYVPPAQPDASHVVAAPVTPANKQPSARTSAIS